jgi:hypothetical protein
VAAFIAIAIIVTVLWWIGDCAIHRQLRRPPNPYPVVKAMFTDMRAQRR